LEFTNVVGDELIFRLTFELMCKVLAKQSLLVKDTYFFHEFREYFKGAIMKYCPGVLYNNLMEDERNRIENSCFTSFAVLVDENNLSLKNYAKEKLYIK
jgi:hypothetical protein